MNFLVGHKVMTPDLEQGFVTEITSLNEVVVMLEADRYDAHTPPYDDIVSEYYENNGEGLSLCDVQHPLLGEFTPFGIVRKLELIIDDVILCRFDGANAAIWVSAERRNQLADKVEYLYTYWVKFSYLDSIIDFYDLEVVCNNFVPKSLTHADIADSCIVQVILPDGNLREWYANVEGDGQILSVEVESDDLSVAESINDLKSLGIKKAQLVSTYSMEGFEVIK